MVLTNEEKLELKIQANALPSCLSTQTKMDDGTKA